MSGWLGLDWGNVSGWFGSGLTAVSAAVAAAAYVRSVRDREREQASRVAAWVALDARGRQVVYVTNRSDASVFELTVTAKLNPPLRLWELPAGNTAQALLGSRAPVSKTVELELRWWVLSVESSREMQEVTSRPELTFRDALGRGWRRDGKGSLKHLGTWQTIAYTTSTKFLPLSTDQDARREGETYRHR